MAKFADSFDGMAEDQYEGMWTAWNTAFNLAAGVPGFLGNALRLNTAFSQIQKTMAPASRVVASLRLMADRPETNAVLTIRSGSQVEFELFTSPAGFLQIRRLGSTGVLVNTPALLSSNVATWVEVVLDVSPTANGNLWVYVGNALVYSELGVITSRGPTTVDNFLFGTSGAASAIYHFDDIVIQTGPGMDRLGESHVHTLQVTGDAYNLNFAPSSGSDLYAMLNDLNAATVVTADTAGDEFACTLEDEAVVNTVHFVQWRARIAEASAAGRQVKPLFRNGTTNWYGDLITVSTAPRWYPQVLDTDPFDGGPWSVAKVNALQPGLGVTF